MDDMGNLVRVQCPRCKSTICLPADLPDQTTDRHCPICESCVPFMPEACVRCGEATNGQNRGTWHGKAGSFCDSCCYDLNQDEFAERLFAETDGEERNPDPNAPF